METSFSMRRHTDSILVPRGGGSLSSAHKANALHTTKLKVGEKIKSIYFILEKKAAIKNGQRRDVTQARSEDETSHCSET